MLLSWCRWFVFKLMMVMFVLRLIVIFVVFVLIMFFLIIVIFLWEMSGILVSRMFLLFLGFFKNCVLICVVILFVIFDIGVRSGNVWLLLIVLYVIVVIFLFFKVCVSLGLVVK